MADDESGACIIHPRVLSQMRFEHKIIPRCITLTGFNNAVERTSGEITLPVLAGGVTLETTFHVMNQDTAYNAIIGRQWIHAMRAIPSSLYQGRTMHRPSMLPHRPRLHVHPTDERSGRKDIAITAVGNWLNLQMDTIKDPNIMEAVKSMVEDLDPVQLNNTDSSKKAYIRHKLSEPDMLGISKDVATHKLNVDPFYPPIR
uniref:Uncharacterized protein LOC104230342 n=1 Tax=Nicotiana sylvestris TaxID=4096 RepID=A0A1U7X4N0_NICSY|nr:PREDICTED: uncharacterized protein LOC104230342 [Nicotiana sylvestris]